jgi:uncharacterized membrane protein
MVDWLADEQGVAAGLVARQLLFGAGAGPSSDPESARLMLGAVAVLARDSDVRLLARRVGSRRRPTWPILPN